MTLRIQLTFPPTLKLDIVLNGAKMKHTTMQKQLKERKTQAKS
jgi:hypothetical protein